jgi:phage/plasmid-associated DNA primase
MWLWICSCIKFNGMTEENWERFGELNELNWDTEKEKLFDSCKTDSQKNNIICLQRIAEQNNPEQYKLWLKKWGVYNISAHEVTDPFAASKVIYKSLQHSLRLSKESWFMLQKNNLWKSQKEAGFFIVEEMHKYLDHGRNCLNDLVNNSEGEEKEKYTNELKKWMGFYQLVSSNSYISGITKYLRTLLVDDEFPERLNSLKGKLAFRNGIMDLETKTFREGIQWDDYVTETIPHDYHPVESTDFVKEKLKLIVNNNDEHLEYHLSVFGFSFIGMPDLMKSVFFHIDKTDGGKGDNGKSFFFSILNELMPNYVYKSKASFLDKHNKTIHKQLSHIKGKRLIYLEEMPKTQAMNHSLFKEIGDGSSIENEIMYGTCEKIKVQCVLHALSNHIPDLSAEEEACYNRYRQISYNSHFDRTGSRTEANFETLEFIADETLKERIISNHADEVFNILIDYAHKFFIRGKKLPPIPAQFSKDTKETKDKNDKFGVWFSENMEVGVGYKVPIKKLEWESKFSAKEIKEGMKRKGYVYNSDLCGMDKDFSGKYYKGGFEGVRIMVDFNSVVGSSN